MPDRAWSIEKPSKGHGRKSFDCGVSELDETLQRFARQNEAAGISQHFVAVDAPGAPVIHAVEVVAINESARSFYRNYGFHPLRDDRHHLYLPIATVKKPGLVWPGSKPGNPLLCETPY
ncbi:MAG: hypothetical protein HND55_10275 [Pseudomonadota bacterium]|nr:MAG: hypothetical protein HND55_10275 [Pseudomonadota bacterium]